MRLVVLASFLAALAACRPGPVVPHDPSRRVARENNTEVDRDTTQSVAPPSSVIKNDGSSIQLESLWTKHRVLLVFYRGQWCPHCKRQLETLQQYQKAISDLGAIIVGVSVDSPADAKGLHDRLNLAFDLYSDPELTVIAKWGVEDYGKGISLPATFIVEPGGAISFRKVGESQTDRPTIEELLAALGKNAPAATPATTDEAGGGSTGVIPPPTPN